MARPYRWRPAGAGPVSWVVISITSANRRAIASIGGRRWLAV
jgi:hypothetical protein